MNNSFSNLGCAADDFPADFAEYLGRRLNVTPGDVLLLLGKCLVEYRAEGDYEISVLNASDATELGEPALPDAARLATTDSVS